MTRRTAYRTEPNMRDELTETPEEARTEQVNVRLTPSEKADVRLVAAFDVRPESDVLREAGLAAVRQRAADIRAGRGIAA